MRPSLLAPLLALVSVACLTNPYAKSRKLHYVGETLVSSEPVPPFAYEAYLRARLALERTPPDLPGARIHIEEALRWDDRDPQLWTTLAEIAWLSGDATLAEAALDEALELAPDYPQALALRTRMGAV